MTGESPGLEVPGTLVSVTRAISSIDGLYSCEIANVTGSEDNKCRVASERDRINCHRV